MFKLKKNKEVKTKNKDFQARHSRRKKPLKNEILKNKESDNMILR